MINQRDIVLLSFPFSELRTTKVRPVIVVSNDEYNKNFENMIVVPMTTNLQLRDHTLLITNKELESGKLIKESKVKVDRIFSVSQKLVKMKIGKVERETYEAVKKMILGLFE